MMKKTLGCMILSVLVWGCNSGNSGKTGNQNNQLPNPCGNVGGTSHGYVLTDIYVPRNLAEGVGMDFDNNGAVDNKLASLMGLLLSESSDFEINTRLAASIAEGKLVVLSRIMADNFTGDPSLSVSLFPGSFTGANPADIFDGTGTFEWDTESQNVGTLCGRVYGAGMLQAGPGSVTLQLPVSDDLRLSIVLHHARMQGIASADGWDDMIIAGLVLPEDLKDSIIPNYVDNVNHEIQSDPAGSQFILNTFDNRCSDDIPGCAGNPGCVADGIITEAELKCNSIINTILTPDVTLDGQQYVSFGIRVQAARASITNL